MACDKAKEYIEKEIEKGTRQFDRSNSMVQELLNSANVPDVEAFIQSTKLRSMLYG
jgi:hypothetical protein